MTHSPKTAALEAYASDLLSDAGRARLEQHLAACEVCRRELATLRVYRDSQAEILRTQPDVDWSKLELALAREARTQSQAIRRGRQLAWVAGASILAAAAAFAVYLTTSHGSSTTLAHSISTTEVPSTVPPTESPNGPSTESPVPAAWSVTASLVAGHPTADGAPIAPGAPIVGGAQIPASSALQLALAHADEPVGRIAVAAETELASLDPASGIALSRGRVAVDAFGGESRVVVLAGAYRIAIVSARCTIELDDAGALRIAVDALEDRPFGSVEVRDDTQLVDRADSAPHTWSSVPGRAAPRPLAFAPDLGPLLRLDWPNAARFVVDGFEVAAGDALAMHVGHDRAHVQVFDARGHEFATDVALGASGAALEPDDLSPVRPHIEGMLSTEEITPVIQRSQRALQRCYEQALRVHPDVGNGTFQARVTLDGRGNVRRVSFTGDDAPESLRACVSQEATHWVFPPPGGPMSFELPLRFRAQY